MVCRFGLTIVLVRSVDRIDIYGTTKNNCLLALLCRLVNGWAQEPMKDVPSCDKPRGGAWNL
jgi:hypothetical protein